MLKYYDRVLGICLLVLLMVGFGIIQKEEAMNNLDNAMQLMWQLKRFQLWKLSARMDNAMIETFQRNGLEANDHMEIDKYCGFGNMRLKPENLSRSVMDFPPAFCP